MTTRMETLMDDLAAWLPQIWDEQERAEGRKYRRRDGIPELAQTGPFWDDEEKVIIRRRHGGPEELMLQADYLAEFCEPNPDQFALARIAADRQILALHRPNGRNILGYPVCDACTPLKPTPCPTVRLLALPYADRPGYREEWRP